MPELPEVETVRRGLQPAMEGSKIVRKLAVLVMVQRCCDWCAANDSRAIRRPVASWLRNI
jgi:formamidopyrimidine-DNA glycosylase